MTKESNEFKNQKSITRYFFIATGFTVLIISLYFYGDIFKAILMFLDSPQSPEANEALDEVMYNMIKKSFLPLSILLIGWIWILHILAKKHEKSN